MSDADLRKKHRPEGVLVLAMNRPEVHNAFDDRQVRRLGAALARTLLKNAPEAVRLSRQLAFDVSSHPISDELIADTVRLIARVRDSDEGREGLSAFLEKRAQLDQRG